MTYRDRYRRKMWVGIPENKNAGCRSICMPGKVNNGLLIAQLNDIKNDLFQDFCVLASFFRMTFSRYRLLLFLFHSLEVHFMDSYSNNQMFVGPLNIKMKHLSLPPALKTENIELSPSCLYLFLSVLFIEQCYTGLLTAPRGTIM